PALEARTGQDWPSGAAMQVGLVSVARPTKRTSLVGKLKYDVIVEKDDDGSVTGRVVESYLGGGENREVLSKVDLDVPPKNDSTRFMEFSGVLPPRWSRDKSAHTGVVKEDGRVFHLPKEVMGRAVRLLGSGADVDGAERAEAEQLTLLGLAAFTVTGVPDSRIYYVLPEDMGAAAGVTRIEPSDTDYVQGIPRVGLVRAMPGKTPGLTRLTINSKELPAMVWAGAARIGKSEVVKFTRPAGSRTVTVVSLSGVPYGTTE